MHRATNTVQKLSLSSADPGRIRKNLFFGKARNDNHLSLQKLWDLADFAETIQEPSIFGQYDSDEHYLKTLELVLESTDETRNRIQFFLKQIIPNLQTKEYLLDVGPGDGALTKALVPEFKHITAVDSSQHILSHLETSLGDRVELIKILDSVESVQFPPDQYDLGVLSHVLYYIDPRNWMDILQKVYRAIKPSGLLVIVMGGDERGKANLIRSFGGNIPNINQFAEACKTTFGHKNVQFSTSNEAFGASTLNAMLHISAFMLRDANVTAGKEDLTRYIETNFKLFENYYEMTTCQKYIMIKKV